MRVPEACPSNFNHLADGHRLGELSPAVEITVTENSSTLLNWITVEFTTRGSTTREHYGCIPDRQHTEPIVAQPCYTPEVCGDNTAPSRDLAGRTFRLCDRQACSISCTLTGSAAMFVRLELGYRIFAFCIFTSLDGSLEGRSRTPNHNNSVD